MVTLTFSYFKLPHDIYIYCNWPTEYPGIEAVVVVVADRTYTFDNPIEAVENYFYMFYAMKIEYPLNATIFGIFYTESCWNSKIVENVESEILYLIKHMLY